MLAANTTLIQWSDYEDYGRGIKTLGKTEHTRGNISNIDALYHLTSKAECK